MDLQNATEVILYASAYKDKLRNFINTKKLDSINLNLIESMLLFHVNIDQLMLTNVNCNLYLNRLLELEQLLINRYSPEDSNIETLLIESMQQYQILLDAKCNEHYKIYEFVDKICRATITPAKHFCSDWLKNKFEIVVANNRLWINFFDKHAIRFAFNDHKLTAYIDHVPKQGGLYFEADDNDKFDFRNESWHSISLAFYISNSLMSNRTFRKLMSSWHLYSARIDEQRIELLHMLNVCIKAKQQLQLTKAGDIAFRFNYKVDDNESFVHEQITDCNGENLIGTLKHNIWQSADNFQKFTILPITTFVYEAEYPI